MSKLQLLIASLLCGSLLSAGNIVVSWPKITNAVQYSICYGETITTIQTITQNKFIIENVPAGQTYYIYIKAINAAGEESQPSKIIKIKIPNTTPSKQLEAPKPSATFIP